MSEYRLFTVTSFNAWDEETHELTVFHMVAKDMTSLVKFLEDEGTLEDTASIIDEEVWVDVVL